MLNDGFVPFVQTEAMEAGQEEMLAVARECENCDCFDCNVNCEECDSR